jgi:hypothetical protein
MSRSVKNPAWRTANARLIICPRQNQPSFTILSAHAPAPPQDVITYAAMLMGIEPPPEQDLETVDLSPLARSFYAENKRASNRKLKDAFGIRLTYDGIGINGISHVARLKIPVEIWVGVGDRAKHLAGLGIERVRCPESATELSPSVVSKCHSSLPVLASKAIRRPAMPESPTEMPICISRDSI